MEEIGGVGCAVLEGSVRERALGNFIRQMRIIKYPLAATLDDRRMMDTPFTRSPNSDNLCHIKRCFCPRDSRTSYFC